MKKMIALSLALSLGVLAPAAQAGIFKKLIVVGAVVVAGKAIAKKHQENKDNQQQNERVRSNPQAVGQKDSQHTGPSTWANRSPIEQR